MFQYAAARTLAQRVNCGLLAAGQTLGRRHGIVGYCLGLDRRVISEREPQIGLQRNGVLNRAFGRGPNLFAGRVIELAIPAIRKTVLRRTFSPKRFQVDATSSFEDFDERLFSQTSGTWLNGWLQSEKYFSDNSADVRGWFAPTSRLQEHLDEVMRKWPASPEQMVAVHVRLGDYKIARGGLNDGTQGWELPVKYFRDALDRLPSDAPLAVFSDDPDMAAEFFSDRKPWVSRGNSPAVDMLLMASCRRQIISNSSFSWWAGWLNARPDKVVIAPRYHLGWRIDRWVPGGIDVAGWTYIDAKPSARADQNAD